MTELKPNLTMTTMDSPLGVLRLFARGDFLTGVYMSTQASTEELDAQRGRSRVLDQTREQLVAYFARQLRVFELPLAPEGTEFQRTVWTALRLIPCGETWSYGQLATAIGNPNAGRAVGAANSKNPIGIIVPCHRVIGADGSLTGYAGGVEQKKWLLGHEQAQAPLKW